MVDRLSPRRLAVVEQNYFTPDRLLTLPN